MLPKKYDFQIIKVVMRKNCIENSHLHKNQVCCTKSMVQNCSKYFLEHTLVILIFDSMRKYMFSCLPHDEEGEKLFLSVHDPRPYHIWKLKHNVFLVCTAWSIHSKETFIVFTTFCHVFLRLNVFYNLIIFVQVFITNDITISY